MSALLEVVDAAVSAPDVSDGAALWMEPGRIEAIARAERMLAEARVSLAADEAAGVRDGFYHHAVDILEGRVERLRRREASF